jgi:predicted Rossmann fold nucleotide-binding protein DprA/Smf involved in DNA uptake
MRQEDSLATILLVSPLAADGLKPLKAAEFWPLCEQIGTPSVLLGRSAHDLITRHVLAPELARRIASLLDRATRMAFELERLEQTGLTVLTPFDEHYPPRFVARLGAKAPPLLHAAGAVELFERAAVGVVGSGAMSAESGEVAKAIADRGAKFGLPLVSGGAPGLDQLTMGSAWQTQGTVVGILAGSLGRTLRSPAVRRAIHGGTTVLCTPYRPDAPSSRGNALGRNKLLYAQSVLTVVVACDAPHDADVEANGEADREADEGGTWSGVAEALEQRFGQVVVWRGPGEGEGNRLLEARGATPIISIEALDALLARS